MYLSVKTCKVASASQVLLIHCKPKCKGCLLHLVILQTNHPLPASQAPPLSLINRLSLFNLALC